MYIVILQGYYVLLLIESFDVALLPPDFPRNSVSPPAPSCLYQMLLLSTLVTSPHPTIGIKTDKDDSIDNQENDDSHP